MAFARKRGEKWEVRKHGVTKSKSFTSKTAATAWATALEAELDRAIAGHNADVKTAAMGDMIRKDRSGIKPYKPWGRSKDAALNKVEKELGRLRPKNLTSRRVEPYASPVAG
ncbi:hypothetical protein AB9F29_09585 [Falsihalocynthiibacter sp. S25ZX9]|uniref:hypothetical protein n=1 Tax=Falsihalocynthiibacter sp. S25ZX9 TaxID=3240870 RepID=UPI00350EDC63